MAAKFGQDLIIKKEGEKGEQMSDNLMNGRLKNLNDYEI